MPHGHKANCPRVLLLLTLTERLVKGCGQQAKHTGIYMLLIPYLILVIKEGVHTGPCANIPNLDTFVR